MKKSLILILVCFALGIVPAGCGAAGRAAGTAAKTVEKGVKKGVDAVKGGAHDFNKGYQEGYENN